MSDELETLLRRAIRGGLLRVSLHENWDDPRNPRRPKWAASYMHTESNLIFYVDADDPIEAFKKAIKTGEAEAKRGRDSKTAQKPYDREVKQIQRENRANIAEIEEDRERQIRKRRRDADSFI